MRKRTKRNRFVYAVALALVIAAGLASRSSLANNLPEFLAEYAGDALWSTALYLTLCIFYPTARVSMILTSAIVISFAVEFSQLYQAEWINSIRMNRVGALFLGIGFKWSDLPCYVAGSLIGAGADLPLIFLGTER